MFYCKLAYNKQQELDQWIGNVNPKTYIAFFFCKRGYVIMHNF